VNFEAEAIAGLRVGHECVAETWQALRNLGPWFHCGLSGCRRLTRDTAQGTGLVSSRRDGKMVMYSLTSDAQGLLAALGERGGGAGVSTEAASAGVRLPQSEYRRLARRVKALSWFSLGWMTLEGGIVILAGISAGSIELVGFGIDSAIEGFASAIIVWRFTGRRMFSESAERRAQKLVAIQFFVLAPYVAFESGKALVAGEHADTSLLGMALAASSLVVMPYLGLAKQRLADRLGSAATKGEGRQNMLCAYLAGALLSGLLGSALFGAWWLDPAVGLLIAWVAVKEGAEAWRGEGCACVRPSMLRTSRLRRATTAAPDRAWREHAVSAPRPG
jgi:Cation efflux family